MDDSFFALPLREQLAELENLYAECLLDGTDRATLKQLWTHIQDIRSRTQESRHRLFTRR
ncbi:MAG: hypothetical protein JWP27_2740 [Flaviaesturariibacter sp.]|nr:hypothetical protein [Flaviaesturariibacter sp.]